jgi:chromosome partitioning protein
VKTVLIANRKGGVGKTLAAVTIASALAARGGRVTIADADRQQSSLGWLQRRPADAAAIRGVSWQKGTEIGDAPKKTEWLVIDAPGALKGGKAEALIAEARAVVTPIQPGIFDLDSTDAFLAEIEELKRVRKGKVPVHILVNRARTGGRAARALEVALAARERGAIAWIAERAAYGELAARGLAVFDFGNQRRNRAFETLQSQWQPLIAALCD